MKAMTISEAFLSVIGEREVMQAFFSTYSFEPDFFELEVLPLLLGNPALSSNETIRYYQLQSLMRQHTGRLAVLYDLDVFDPQLAPKLEVDYLPMRVGGACQHAKLIVLVVYERDTEQLKIVLGAGSFNLTKAGWWENLEVGHWVELSEDFAPSNIHKPLLDALRFYQARTPTPVLEAILALAQSFKATADDSRCAFYFSGCGTERVDFDEFISNNADANAPLEVISPFFAAEGDNQVVLNLLKRYPSVIVLLPLDEHGQALVDRKSVYEVLPNETITWGRWSESIRKSHLDPAGYRKLHAKIYQSLGEDPWVFVGSVNLSFKAFRQNVEAGFLLREHVINSLLVPLQAPPDKFKEEQEVPNRSSTGSEGMPAIHALFDWQSGTLHLTSTQAGSLTLLNNASEDLLSVQLNSLENEPFRETQLLELYLQGSSLVHARWQSEGVNAIGTVLISQCNIFCRPNHLPPLDLQALLRIFIGMHDSRRLELFGDLAVRLLQSSQEEGLQDEFLPELTSEGSFESFFSEFSQVNGAFWVLAARLQKAALDGDSQTLAYYLKGQQPDSLRKLLETIAEATGKSSPSLIVRYLTLLSVAGLLKHFTEHEVAPLLEDVNKALLALEQNELLTQLNEERGKQFLRWFKAKFFEPVATMTCSSKEGVCFAKN